MRINRQTNQQTKSLYSSCLKYFSKKNLCKWGGGRVSRSSYLSCLSISMKQVMHLKNRAPALRVFIKPILTVFQNIQLFHGTTDWMSHWLLTKWATDELIDWISDWLTNWLTDWSTFQPTNQYTDGGTEQHTGYQ